MTDNEAILRCQDGDRDAFRYLVEQYKDVLFGTAVLMTGNRAVAEDQVQEALLSAWRGQALAHADSGQRGAGATAKAHD